MAASQSDITEEVNKFFKEILLLKDGGPVPFNNLRGYFAKAPSDVKEYVKKKCKGENLLKYFQKHKKLFLVDKFYISLKMERSAAPQNDERPRENEDVPKNRNRNLSTSSSSSKSRSTSECAQENLKCAEEKVEYDQISRNYFTNYLQKHNEIILSDIDLDALPKKVHRFLEKYMKKNISSFFLQYPGLFLVSDGRVRLEPQSPVEVEVSPLEPSTKSLDQFREVREMHENSIEDSRSVNEKFLDCFETCAVYFMKVLEQKGPIPLKKISGHFSHAPDHVSFFIKHNYKPWMSFFEAAPNLFTITNSVIHLSSNYRKSYRRTQKALPQYRSSSMPSKDIIRLLFSDHLMNTFENDEKLNSGVKGLHFIGTSLQEEVDIAETNNLVSEEINADGKATEECKSYDLTVSGDFSSLSSDGFSSPNSFFTASDESLSPSSLVSTAEQSSNSTVDVTASNSCGNIAGKQRMFEHLVNCYYAVHFICFEIVEKEDSLCLAHDYKAVKFFVDILKSTASFDGNLKYLVGRLGQADSDILLLIRQLYKGDKIGEFFKKHKSFDFFPDDLSVELSDDYETHLENTAKLAKSFVKTKLYLKGLCGSTWVQLCASFFEGLLQLATFLQHKKKARISRLCGHVSTMPSFIECLNRLNGTDPTEKLRKLLKCFNFFIPVGENDYSLSDEVKFDIFLSTLEKFSHGFSKENHSKLMLSTHNEYLSENCSTESFSKHDDLKVEIIERVECFLYDIAHVNYSELPQVLGAYIMHSAFHLDLWSYDIIWILLNSGVFDVKNGQISIKRDRNEKVLNGNVSETSDKNLVESGLMGDKVCALDACKTPEKTDYDGKNVESGIDALKISIKNESEPDPKIKLLIVKNEEERGVSDPNVLPDTLNEKNISTDNENSSSTSIKIPLTKILKFAVKVFGKNKTETDSKAGSFPFREELKISNCNEIEKLPLANNVSDDSCSSAALASKEPFVDSSAVAALNSFEENEKVDVVLNVPKLPKNRQSQTETISLRKSFELLLDCYYTAHFLCLGIFEKLTCQSMSLNYRAVKFFIDLLKSTSGTPCKGNLKNLQRKVCKADADVCEMIREQYSGARINTFFLEHKEFDFNSSDLSVKLSQSYQVHLEKTAELSYCPIKSKQHFENLCNPAWWRHCACAFKGIHYISTLLTSKRKMSLDELSDFVSTLAPVPYLVCKLEGRDQSEKLKKLLKTFKIFTLHGENVFGLSDDALRVNCSVFYRSLADLSDEEYCEEKQTKLLGTVHAVHLSRCCSSHKFLKYDDFCVKVRDCVMFLLQDISFVNYSELPQVLGSYIMHSAFHLGLGCSDIMGILYDCGLFDLDNGLISRKKENKQSVSSETEFENQDKIPVELEAIEDKNCCQASGKNVCVDENFVSKPDNKQMSRKIDYKSSIVNENVSKILDENPVEPKANKDENYCKDSVKHLFNEQNFVSETGNQQISRKICEPSNSTKNLSETLDESSKEPESLINDNSYVCQTSGQNCSDENFESEFDNNVIRRKDSKPSISNENVTKILDESPLEPESFKDEDNICEASEKTLHSDKNFEANDSWQKRCKRDIKWTVPQTLDKIQMEPKSVKDENSDFDFDKIIGNDGNLKSKVDAFKVSNENKPKTIIMKGLSPVKKEQVIVNSDDIAKSFSYDHKKEVLTVDVEKDESDIVPSDSLKENRFISTDHKISDISIKVPLVKILRYAVKISDENLLKTDPKHSSALVEEEEKIFDSGEIEDSKEGRKDPEAHKEPSCDSLASATFTDSMEEEFLLVPVLKNSQLSTEKFHHLRSFECLVDCYYTVQFICLEAVVKESVICPESEYKAVKFFVDILKSTPSTSLKANLKNLQRKLSKADADVFQLINTLYGKAGIKDFFMGHKEFVFSPSDSSVSLSEGYETHLKNSANSLNCVEKFKLYFERLSGSQWARLCGETFASLINLASLIEPIGKVSLGSLSRCAFGPNSSLNVFNKLEGKNNSEKLRKFLNSFRYIFECEDDYYSLSNEVASPSFVKSIGGLSKQFSKGDLIIMMSSAHFILINGCVPENFLNDNDFQIKAVERVRFMLHHTEFLKYSELPQVLGAYIMHSALHLGFCCSDIIWKLAESGLFCVDNGLIKRKQDSIENSSPENVPEASDNLLVERESIKDEKTASGICNDQGKNDEKFVAEDDSCKLSDGIQTETGTKADCRSVKDEINLSLCMSDAGNLNLKHMDTETVDTSLITESLTKPECSEISIPESHIRASESFLEDTEQTSHINPSHSQNSCSELNYEVGEVSLSINTSNSTPDDISSVETSDSKLECMEEGTNALLSLTDVSEQEFDIFKFALDVEKGVFDDYLEKIIFAGIENSNDCYEAAPSAAVDEGESKNGQPKSFSPISNKTCQEDATNIINSPTKNDFNDSLEETYSVIVDEDIIKDKEPELSCPKPSPKTHKEDESSVLNCSAGKEDFKGSSKETYSVAVDEDKTKDDEPELSCAKSSPKTQSKDERSTRNSSAEKDFQDSSEETSLVTAGEVGIKNDQPEPSCPISSPKTHNKDASSLISCSTGKDWDDSSEETYSVAEGKDRIKDDLSELYCSKSSPKTFRKNATSIKNSSAEKEDFNDYSKEACSVTVDEGRIKDDLSEPSCPKSSPSAYRNDASSDQDHDPTFQEPITAKVMLMSSDTCIAEYHLNEERKLIFCLKRTYHCDEHNDSDHCFESLNVGDTVWCYIYCACLNCNPGEVLFPYMFCREQEENISCCDSSRKPVPAPKHCQPMAPKPELNCSLSSVENVTSSHQNSDLKCEERSLDHFPKLPVINETSHICKTVLADLPSYVTESVLNCLPQPALEFSENYCSNASPGRDKTNQSCDIDRPTSLKECVNSLNADSHFQTDITGDIRPCKDSRSSTCQTDLTGEVKCCPRSVSASCQTISQSVSVISQTIPTPRRLLSVVKQFSISLDGPDMVEQSVQCGSSDEEKFKSSTCENSAAVCDATSQTLSTGAIIVMNYVP